jgi:hypothetical protein
MIHVATHPTSNDAAEEYVSNDAVESHTRHPLVTSGAPDNNRLRDFVNAPMFVTAKEVNRSRLTQIVESEEVQEALTLMPEAWDLRAEASERVRFKPFAFLHIFFAHWLFPFSLWFIQVIALWRPSATLYIRRAHMLPGADILAHKTINHTTGHKFAAKPNMFFATSINYFLGKATVISCLSLGYYWRHRSGSDTAQREALTPAAEMLGWLYLVIQALHMYTIAVKHAYRRDAAQRRMLSSLARRDEEFTNGWIPLPIWLAMFELRLAAVGTKCDLEQSMCMHGSVEEMCTFLGPQVMKYAREESLQVCDDGDGGCSVPCRLVLLRAVLQDSLAHPLDMQKPLDKWIGFSWALGWKMMLARGFTLSICLLPFFVEHVLLGRPWVVYHPLSTTLCVVSTVLGSMHFDVVLSGFASAVMITLSRKRFYMEFLGDLISGDGGSPEMVMRFTVKNLLVWNDMRETLLAVGTGYRKRIEAQVVMVLLIFTSMFAYLLASVAASHGKKVPFTESAQMVGLFIFLIVSCGGFAGAVGLSGAAITDACLAHIQQVRLRLFATTRAADLHGPTAIAQYVEQICAHISSKAAQEPEQVFGAIALDAEFTKAAGFGALTQLIMIFQHLDFGK